MRFAVTSALSCLLLLGILVVGATAVVVTPYGYPLKDVLEYQEKHRYRYGLRDQTTVVRRDEDESSGGGGEVLLEARDPSTRSHHGKGTDHSHPTKPATHCIPDTKKVVVKRDGEAFVWLWKRSAPVHTTAKCKGIQRLHPLP